MGNIEVTELNSDALQCVIETTGCEYGKQGSCLVCNYGHGSNLSKEELLQQLRTKLTPLVPHYTYLVFSAYGSIVDEREFSRENLDVLLDYIKEINIDTVSFETHCLTVTPRSLTHLRNKLPNQKIALEIGLETSDDTIIASCLNKFQVLNDVDYAMRLAKQYNMEVDLNILFGLPFMNTRKQIDSTLDSIKWAYENGAKDIVLFPCNIKAGTTLSKLYRHHKYEPISQWDFIILLSLIPDEILPKIALSWYGNRVVKDKETGIRSMPPVSCGKCKNRILDFYDQFINTRNLYTRKQLIRDIQRSSFNCNCREAAYAKLIEKPFLMDYISIQEVLRICHG